MRNKRVEQSEELSNERGVLQKSRRKRAPKNTKEEQPESKERIIVSRLANNVVAIDYSYVECGFAVFEKGELKEVKKLNFKEIEARHSVKLNNRKKRELIRVYIRKNFENYSCYVLERVRLFSHGFISMNSIAALVEITTTIIDALPSHCSIVSIDTRSWKKAALGSAKSTKKNKKEETMQWAESLLTRAIKEKRDYKPLTDNEADAVGIGWAYYKGVNIKDEV